MMHNLIILSSQGLDPLQSYVLLEKFKPFDKKPVKYPYYMYIGVSREKISHVIPFLEENLIYYQVEEFRPLEPDRLPVPNLIGAFEMFLLAMVLLMAFFLYREHVTALSGLDNLIRISFSQEKPNESTMELKSSFKSAFTLFAYNRDGSVTSGTGFFIDKSGLALTSCHVVDNARSLEIQSELYNTSNIEIIGKDRYFDIAVIGTDQSVSDPIEFASIREAETKGTVYSLGNPYGISLMVSRGIISSLSNAFGGILYIQTDARIKQGSSGGPLLLPDGRCIGINTFLIYKDADIGLGFCIPAGYLGFVYPDLITNELAHDQNVYKGIMDSYFSGLKSELEERYTTLHGITQVSLSIINNRQGIVFFDLQFYNIEGAILFSGELNLEFKSRDHCYSDVHRVSKKDYRDGILRLEYSYNHPVFDLKSFELVIKAGGAKKTFNIREEDYN